jgi:hypothetical protein
MDKKFAGNPDLVKSTYYKPEYIHKIVDEIKNPLKLAVRDLFNPALNTASKTRALIEAGKILKKVRELPRPTRENTKRYTSHQLIEIRDYFFSRIKNVPYMNEFEMAWDLGIIVNDTDFYSSFILELILEIKKRDWPSQGPMQPDPHFWETKNISEVKEK